jgi:hypothetical protein
MKKNERTIANEMIDNMNIRKWMMKYSNPLFSRYLYSKKNSDKLMRFTLRGK